jgi:hypothetical protein
MDAKIVKLRKAEKIEMRRQNALAWIRDQQRRAERKAKRLTRIGSTTMGAAMIKAGLV